MLRIIPLATASLALAWSISNPAQAGLEEGVAAYEAGNVPLAIKEFRTAAEKGDANCQYNLALMYEQGIGLAKDEKEAVGWYKKSAELGNSNAQFNLGVLYENGRGTAVDFEKANQWYRKAATQGDALAIGNLGMLYVRGDGVKIDRVAGVALLMQSATLENTPTNNAKQNLAGVKGLNKDMITQAQALMTKFAKAKDLTVPLDQHLKATAGQAVDKAK